MKVARKIGILVLAIGFVPLAGCFLKKKKPPVPPPQGQAPTITVPITPAQLPPEAPPPAPPAPTTTPTKPTASKPKPKHRAKKSATSNPPATVTPATPAPATTAKNSSKTVPEGGANDSSVQISAEVPRDAAAQQRQDTTQLLDSTEANLRKVGNRTLNDNDQATMRQIRNYITQSRLAMQDGDLERAYNLATKANLLSNEFVKRL